MDYQLKYQLDLEQLHKLIELEEDCEIGVGFEVVTERDVELLKEMINSINRKTETILIKKEKNETLTNNKK